MIRRRPGSRLQNPTYKKDRPLQYQDAVAQLLSLADFERKSRANEPPDFHLRRMAVLLARLGNPEQATPTVHVAGSKGKGSTAAMIAAALTASGLRTGLFTSPHLHRMTERVRVDGVEMRPERFAALVEELWGDVEAIEGRGDAGRVSVFELLTAMAFVEFRAVGAQAQVIEVGLGGRLDATNLVMPEVCVITPISLDHTAVLGDTVPKIAFEKAGIIKPGVPVVVGRQAPAARTVISEVAAGRGSRLIYAHDWLTAEPDPVHSFAAGRPPIQRVRIQGGRHVYDIDLPLPGAHQVGNAVTAVAALETFAERTGAPVTPGSVASGIGAVRWPARVEVLTSPDEAVQVVVDGAHNSASAAALVSTIEALFPAAGRVVLVYAGSGGHDYAATAREFAHLDPTVVVTRTRHPKAVDPETVADALRCDNVRVAMISPDVESALVEARSIALPGDIIVATGSLFVAAEVRESVLSIAPEIYPDLHGDYMPPYQSQALVPTVPQNDHGHEPGAG